MHFYSRIQEKTPNFASFMVTFLLFLGFTYLSFATISSRTAGFRFEFVKCFRGGINVAL